jgi:hypothetical protein
MKLYGYIWPYDANSRLAAIDQAAGGNLDFVYHARWLAQHYPWHHAVQTKLRARLEMRHKRKAS